MRKPPSSILAAILMNSVRCQPLGAGQEVTPI